MEKLAILYQSGSPPMNDGLQKPMKPGGYSDSGADIAYELFINGVSIVTPVDNPKLNNDLDWVFPDNRAGIQKALNMGAKIFWLNTVLYKDHPIGLFYDKNIEIIGHHPRVVDAYDNKIVTNKLLKSNGLSIPEIVKITKDEPYDLSRFKFPVVLKPIRGRGSQGVCLEHNERALEEQIVSLFSSEKFGNSLYIEAFLPGQEITVTVMPAGKYYVNGEIRYKDKPWSLPAVKRFNHQNGIAPYSGVMAVINNSAVLDTTELHSKKIIEVYRQCEKAAKLVQAKAPLRIDCRADESGDYFLFDLNMKPNMTGPSRSHRQDQDSLTSLAARKIGWSYADLLKNMLNQKWKLTD